MRSKRIMSLVAASVLFAGCTPAQLLTYERRTGTKIPAEFRKELLAAPNTPIVLEDGLIMPDGSFIKHVAPPGSRCPQHYGAALAAGWSASDWARLDYIIYRESRCVPTAHNPRPPDDSYGLMQLNMRAHRSWVGPLVNWNFSRLFEPVVNFRMARVLFNKARSAYGCGWQPWNGC